MESAESIVKGHSIRVRGAREMPLRDVDVDIPLGGLLCVLGRSGSGHRTLLERVLYAESQARYMRALTPFEREGQAGTFRVEVDSISGLPPVINYMGWQRVPAGTLASYMALDGPLAQFFLANGVVRCPACRGICRSFRAEEVEAEVSLIAGDGLVTVLAPLSLSTGGDGQLLLAELRRSGFVRVRIGGDIFRLDGELPELGENKIEVVVDRLRAGGEDSRRFVEAVRSSRAISRGQTWVVAEDACVHVLNQLFTCAECARQYDPISVEDMLDTGAAIEWGECVEWGGRSFAQTLAQSIGEIQNLFEAEFAGEVPGTGKALSALCGMGLGYLTPADKLSQLSTGEWQRLRLVACLGAGLSGILYLFSGVVGAVDSAQRGPVIAGLRQLVETGNTVAVVDSAPELVASADIVWECERGAISRKDPAELRRGVGGRIVRSGQDEWCLQGKGDWGDIEQVLPRGAMIGLTGPSGAGKTQFLKRVVEPALRGSAKDYRAQWMRGRMRVHVPNRIMRARSLLHEVGLMAPVAELFARSPAGLERSYPADFFSLDKPGGRCPACEGRGSIHYDLEFADDLELVCATCEGRRFRDEVLDITYRGTHIAEVLAMEASRACAHFSRERAIAERLAPLDTCGVGHLRLGDGVDRLEWGEGLRLQLALALRKANERDFLLLDHPTLGEHPDEVCELLDVLIALIERGSTIIVVDHHPDIMASCSTLLAIKRPRRGGIAGGVAVRAE